MNPLFPVKTVAGPGWVVVLAACVAAAPAEETIYAKVGGEVTLKPKSGSVTDATTAITWKVGVDLAVELDDGYIDYYRNFKQRGDLNNRTGELKITRLEYNDTEDYTIEIDKNPLSHKIHLVVLSPVPAPTIAPSCSEDASTCTLTCEGNTTRAEPVEYIWTSDNAEGPVSRGKTYTVEKDSLGVKEFTCKMKNPVSEKSSKPFSNPFKAAESGPKISTGVTVLVILLVPVILVAILHRLRTGEWFFNKSSMPWEGDFWRNTRGKQLQTAASDSNGATTPVQGKPEEQTTMMD